MTDRGRWSQWFPVIEAVWNVMAVGRGATFEWHDEGRTGQGTIVRLEPKKRLQIATRIGDDKDSHLFELKAKGGFLGLGAARSCRVRYTVDTLMGGGIPASLVAGGNPMDTMRVKKALGQLEKLAAGKEP